MVPVEIVVVFPSLITKRQYPGGELRTGKVDSGYLTQAAGELQS